VFFVEWFYGQLHKCGPIDRKSVWLYYGEESIYYTTTKSMLFFDTKSEYNNDDGDGHHRYYMISALKCARRRWFFLREILPPPLCWWICWYTLCNIYIYRWVFINGKKNASEWLPPQPHIYGRNSLENNY